MFKIIKENTHKYHVMLKVGSVEVDKTLGMQAQMIVTKISFLHFLNSCIKLIIKNNLKDLRQTNYRKSSCKVQMSFFIYMFIPKNLVLVSFRKIFSVKQDCMSASMS